jgi:hypothetical protein
VRWAWAARDDPQPLHLPAAEAQGLQKRRVVAHGRHDAVRRGGVKGKRPRLRHRDAQAAAVGGAPGFADAVKGRHPSKARRLCAIDSNERPRPGNDTKTRPNNEFLSRVLNRPDGGDQGGRRIRRGPARFYRIESPCKLEQIVAFRRATGIALARCGPGPRGRLAPRGLVRSTCTRSR